jgi:16S rRNA A1518/A1519 N6-dimethyltransferase RsmA/KsgA/DIM1 with predicted DNA glycosylase/AP lyase activity
LRARYPGGSAAPDRADVLDVAFELRALRAARHRGQPPYNISKPVAMKLVVERRAVVARVLMFQREVADRLTAAPGRARTGR